MIEKPGFLPSAGIGERLFSISIRFTGSWRISFSPAGHAVNVKIKKNTIKPVVIYNFFVFIDNSFLLVLILFKSQ
jgi:hypothetical protein